MLSGTVLNSATNAGVAHALVSFTGAQTGYRFTDLSGGFRVEDIPCGAYSLNVSKPGFVPQQDLSRQQYSGGFDPAGLGPSDGEADEQSDVRPTPTFTVADVKPGSPPARIELAPVASIAGTVLDENGEPLMGAAVQGIAVKASLAGADYVPVRTGRTDDRGSYAFADLPPGDYVVRLAGEASYTVYFIGSRLNPANDHRGLQPVYYPSGDSPASASVLRLGPGDRANADFRQACEQAFDIDGRLAGFVPGAWTQIQLYRGADRLPVGAAFVNVSSGQFRVTDVPRGSYTLRAVQYQADPVKWLAAEAQVMVASEPIRNLTIPLSGGTDIPVSVFYEAGARTDGMLHVMLHPQHMRSSERQLLIGEAARPRRLPEGIPEPAPAPKQPMTLTNVIPDKYRLTVQPLGDSGDYVSSAKLGDLDVLRGEFSIGGNEAGELRVTIRGDSASVEGRVSFDGHPAPGTNVYLMPASGDGGGLKTDSCDDDGLYRILGVAPGDYRIQAWKGSPSVAEMLSKPGETLTLQAGERRTMALDAAPASNQSDEGEGEEEEEGLFR